MSPKSCIATDSDPTVIFRSSRSADRGGYAEVAFGVDGDGYRIGYLIQTADLTDLETWGVSEQTEAEALTFCQQFHADASVGADGRILGPLPATE